MEGLVARDIVVHFGGLIALNSVSLEAPPGRITGLIGPNGAGKTTMFNVCCGFLEPVSGTVEYNGVDIGKDSPAQRARRGIGRTFQRMELFRSLTVRENVALAAESLHITNDPLTQLGLIRAGQKVSREIREATDVILELTGLSAFASRLAGEISTGQGRLVELARALARKPSLLMLDEPSSGLDVAESHAFGALLAELVESHGLGVLMIEHDMSLVLGVCDWIQVLDFGRPLMSGTPAEVRASEEVRNAYLGKAVA